MKKRYLKNNVYVEAIKRVNYVFSKFEQVVVSFSGGKDSGILLNIALDIAKKRKELNKLKVYYVDYEANLSYTDEYVKRTLIGLPKEVKVDWICIPFDVPCGTSVTQLSWNPWLLKEKELWVRDLPISNKENINIITENNIKFNYKGSDYSFNDKYADYISKDKFTAFLIGIRGQESLQRLSAVNKKTSKNQFGEIKWSTKENSNTYNMYPIYDWTTEDVWTAYAKNEWDYNKAYDLMFQAGVPLNNMRIASPFLSKGKDGLAQFRSINPERYNKLVTRVAGVVYSTNNHKRINYATMKKPSNMESWKTYAKFLLSTLPQDTRDSMLVKIRSSYNYWLGKKGGSCLVSTVNKLEKNDDFSWVDLHTKRQNINYNLPHTSIRFFKYPDDVPNTDSFWSLPSWKRICASILDGDYILAKAGFGRNKHENELRNKATKDFGGLSGKYIKQVKVGNK